uniref:glutathione transferase n=1 Tax=Anopheles epiroticus TaxID=199890 RepID=A0A182PFT0_9DIPT
MTTDGRLLLYTNRNRPPCRAVRLTVRTLVIELFEKECSPQHTIPVLDERGIVITASQAIMIYLVCKYGSDDNLYPSDLIRRSRVQHDSRGWCHLFPFFITSSSFASNRLFIRANHTSTTTGSSISDKRTGGAWYMVGDSMTIADFSCISSIATLIGVVPLDVTKFRKITAWIQRMEELPYYENYYAIELAEFVLGKKEAQLL